MLWQKLCLGKKKRKSMDNSRTSLIHKVVTKGTVFTPMETMHLKYLSRKGILKELVDVEAQSNPYIAVQEAESIISPYYISFLIDRVQREDPELYSSCNYAYEHLLDLDDGIGRLGYKGLALLTQLTSMRHEHFVRLIISDDSEKKKQQIANGFKNITHPPIMDFSTYSFVHQKEVTFTEILSLLGETFKYFIKSIDNILTLNYYLNQLIDLEDLECLRFLKMWLNNGIKPDSEEHLKPFFNAARLCCDHSLVLYVLNDNHQNYVDSFSREVKNLPMSFGESSLQYVKDTIAATINSL